MRLRGVLAVLVAGLGLLPLAARAQLPAPTYGWNLGNTLEPPGGEGTWGPKATEKLIDAVAKSGFNTVRLPCAWDSHANPATHKIDPAWMARVKQVVDWCVARKLHVVLNDHWDGGWLENHIGDKVDPVIDAKMKSYWKQIATTFRDYDDTLLFAGANEPNADTAKKVATLVHYYESFIAAVRATGGKNTTRWLVIQGPNTNIDLTDKLLTKLPKDPTPKRLVVEVHYYEPYQWSLMNADASWGKMFYFWGKGYHQPKRPDRNASWGEEAAMKAGFQKMADRFVKKGIPVIVGEFQAIKRTGYADLKGADFDLHVASRTYFHKTLVDLANSYGLRPIYWDIAGQMFDWTTGKITDPANQRVLVGGAALPPPGGGGIIANGIYRIQNHHSGKSLEVGSGVTNGSNVRQNTDRATANQRWVLTHLGGNTYRIVGLQSAKALDVAGRKTADGTNVDIWTYTAAGSQKWKVSALGAGWYRLTPVHAPTSSLEVKGASTAAGANVQIATYIGGSGQQWTFKKS